MYLILLYLFVAVLGNKDMYCGSKTCYDILELNFGADQHEIKKSYRKLTLQ